MCQKLLSSPVGPENSLYGILGESPDTEGLSVFPPNSAVGHVLRLELKRAGLDFERFRVTNVWMHPETNAPGELDWHLAQAIKTLKKCTHILILGSVPAQALFGKSAQSISGLWLTSDLMPKKQIITAPSPGTLLHGSVGEFRLALNRFARSYHDNEKTRKK